VGAVRRQAGVIAATLTMGAGLLALPASASAQFTQLTPVQHTLSCPGPIAFDSGSQTVYFGDACDDPPTKGDSSALYAFAADGSAEQAGFGGGEVQTFDDGVTSECFDWLAGAAVDPANGDVYVSDEASGVNALFDFSNTAMDKAQLGNPCPGTITSGGSQVAPQGLAIFNGNLYVAGNGEVFSTPLGLDGLETTLPLTPADTNPIAIAIDPNTGATFVLDGSTNTVYEYSALGTYVGVFASGFSKPTAIAVDPVAQVVYAADAGTGTVDTFAEQSGAALLEAPSSGVEVPYGVALDTTHHVLYVAEQPPTGPYSASGGSVQLFAYTPAPSCNPASAATKGGVATSLTLSCSDQAGAPVTYSVVAGPAHGTVSLNHSTGALTYTPNGSYDGTDTFTYDGSSLDGTSSPTSVTVTVTGPTCAPETLATGYQAQLPVTLACSDSASPVARYEILTPPAHGTLTTPNSGGQATYAPQGITVGVDSFTYEGINANGQASAPQTVTIYIGTTLPPPVQGSSADLYFAYGNVTVLLPGQTTPIPLTGGIQAPLGSVVNATNGGAGVFVEDNGQEQGANFWDGSYKLTQQGDPQTILHLLGDRIPKVKCALHPHSYSGPFTLGQAQQLGKRHPAGLVAKKFHEKGKPSRQLWGNGHGDFTTVGNGSSASVRGTEWAIFDYPDGTLTFDYTDSVSVYDFHRHKHVTITAGHYYFAAIGGLPPCSKG
jgi:DNA-binding beta-propeller fold protein YncE